MIDQKVIEGMEQALKETCDAIAYQERQFETACVERNLAEANLATSRQLRDGLVAALHALGHEVK